MLMRIQAPGQPPTTVQLARGMLLGRDQSCDVVLADDKVSRQHAYIGPEAGGGASVRDLGSTNGTFVDGRRLTGSAPLTGREEIRLGDTVITFAAEDLPVASAPTAAPASPAPADSRIGTVLARYRIERKISEGNMGVVYLAEHLRLGKMVALKVLARRLFRDERSRQRFAEESRAAALIDHPNIIPIYDADDVDGDLYIAMRYVDGDDLNTLLERDGPMDPGQVLSIVAQVGAALDAAHARGLIHRDVKPGNILIASARDPAGAGHVFLCDFGITKHLASTGLTRPGQAVGTPNYMAPEQFMGQPVDHRTDIYALGCVAYECLTGAVPYERDSDEAVMFSHVQSPPPKVSASRPDLPRALDQVVARAMAKSKDDRYDTCADLVAAMRAVLTDDATRVGDVPVPSAGGTLAEDEPVAVQPPLHQAAQATHQATQAGPQAAPATHQAAQATVTEAAHPPAGGTVADRPAADTGQTVIERTEAPPGVAGPDHPPAPARSPATVAGGVAPPLPPLPHLPPHPAGAQGMAPPAPPPRSQATVAEGMAPPPPSQATVAEAMAPPPPSQATVAEGMTAPMPPVPTPLSPQRRRTNRPVLIGLGSFGVVLVVGLLIFLATGGRSGSHTSDSGSTPAPASSLLPPDVSAKPTAFSVDLNWTQPPGGAAVSHYAIYRDDTLLTQTNETTFTDDGLTPDTPYTYEVRAIGSSGRAFAAKQVFVSTVRPSIDDARLTGRFSATFVVTSFRGFDPGVLKVGEKSFYNWSFKPTCSAGACSVTWSDGEKHVAIHMPLTRSARYYRGHGRGVLSLTCGDHDLSADITISIHVVNAEPAPGLWRATRLVGTVTRASTQGDCNSSFTSYRVTATLPE